MTANESLIAKRYAKAFINLYGDAMQQSELTIIDSLRNFLIDKKQLFFFTFSHIDKKTKHQVLDLLFEQIKSKKKFVSLVELLIKEKRVFLLPEILRYISILYKKRNNILSCTISSSHSVNMTELETIKNFLMQQTGHSIMCTYQQDATLIAGIRIQSDTLLWEYSIRKQLANVRLALMKS